MISLLVTVPITRNQLFLLDQKAEKISLYKSVIFNFYKKYSSTKHEKSKDKSKMEN